MFKANSAHPDQTAPDQDLHCHSINIFWMHTKNRTSIFRRVMVIIILAVQIFRISMAIMIHNTVTSLHVKIPYTMY